MVYGLKRGEDESFKQSSFFHERHGDSWYTSIVPINIEWSDGSEGRQANFIHLTNFSATRRMHTRVYSRDNPQISFSSCHGQNHNWREVYEDNQDVLGVDRDLAWSKQIFATCRANDCIYHLCVVGFYSGTRNTCSIIKMCDYLITDVRTIVHSDGNLFYLYVSHTGL